MRMAAAPSHHGMIRAELVEVLAAEVVVLTGMALSFEVSRETCGSSGY